MKIYKNEQDIGDKIKASTSVISPVKLKMARKESRDEIKALIASVVNNLEDSSFKKIFASKKHPFLMYVSAILCSTVINANDDTFIASELWKARNSIKDQPYNEEHEERRIVGHVVNSRVVAEDGSIVADDSTEPPQYFDIEFDAVLYESVFPEIADDILENAEAGKIGVSMECRISDFSYGVVEDSKITIVERNDETSVLSKYLRAYGGKGEYQGKRIVRVLKDLVFVGVANTKNPANEASTYTKINDNVIQATNFDCINNEQGTISDNPVCPDPKENLIQNSTEDITNKQEGNEMFKTLEEAIAHIENQNKELDKLKVEKAAKETKVSELENAITVANEKFSTAESTIANLTKDLDTAKTELTEASTKRDEYKSVLDKAEARKLGEQRVSAMEAIGHDFGDKRDESIEKYSKFPQESYDEIFASVKKHAKTNDTTGVTAAVNSTVDIANSTTVVEGDDLKEKPVDVKAAIQTLYKNRADRKKSAK
jgi:flagellar biosynthesis chaperone FliJ